MKPTTYDDRDALANAHARHGTRIRQGHADFHGRRALESDLCMTATFGGPNGCLETSEPVGSSMRYEVLSNYFAILPPYMYA